VAGRGWDLKDTHYLVVTPENLLVLDEEFRTVRSLPLGGSPVDAARKLERIHEGKPIVEIAELLGGVKAATIVVEDQGIAKAVQASGWGGRVVVEFPSKGGRAVRSRLAGTVEARRLSGIAREIASTRVRRSYEDWDRLVIQAVGAIDEIDRSVANLYARTRDWYSIHFPELERIVKGEKQYINLILAGDPGGGEALPEGVDIANGKRRKIEAAAARTVGVPLGEEDLEPIREIAKAIIDLEARKSAIHAYLEELMLRHAPNLTKVAEASLGARLVARAGSMKKLAMMPSTSVQTLGAEKALFRHITRGAKPPKHGLIFQHPYVRNSPRSIRGKIAGILASRISLAARTDYITGGSSGEALKASLDAAVRDLRKAAS